MEGRLSSVETKPVPLDFPVRLFLLRHPEPLLGAPGGRLCVQTEVAKFSPMKRHFRCV